MMRAIATALLLSIPSLAAAQGVIMVPPTAVKPAQQPAPQANTETPEQMAKDAQRDLADTHFYNKPGATRVEYDRDWQECRLIARGTRTPSGGYVVSYAAGVSPLAAGIGGGIGAAIGMAIIEGQQRRANRRNCLMVRGWRWVQPEAAEEARVAAMGDADKQAWRETMVGAPTVSGKVMQFTPLPTIDADEQATIDAPLVATVRAVEKGADPAAAIVLKPDEGAIVVGLRRPTDKVYGVGGTLGFARYDVAKRDLIYPPRHAKRDGDKTTYFLTLTSHSKNKKLPHDVQVVRVTPGDYVLLGADMTPQGILTTDFCLNAPVFHVGAGEAVYFGSLTARSFSGKKVRADSVTSVGSVPAVYGQQIGEVRAALAGQPALLAALKPAEVRNRASFGCAGTTMTAFYVPGAPDLPPPDPAALEKAPDGTAAAAADPVVGGK